MEGHAISGEEIQTLAKLPPADVLRAQLVGAIAAPMSTVVGLFNAPLRDLVGVLQARIDQLEEQGGSAEAAAPEASAATEPEAAPEPETPEGASEPEPEEEGGEG
jgi:large subunit ribosomal protein L10